MKIFLGKEENWSDASMKQVYLDWIEMVKQSVPAEKLLIFNVKQGWAPLCKFLDLPGKKTLILNPHKLFEEFCGRFLCCVKIKIVSTRELSG